MTPGVTVVLSGGGAKTAAHIGAMRALGERGIPAGRFVGTSMGAVLGACFAAGHSVPEVLDRVSGIRRRDVAALSPGLLLLPLARSILRPDPWRRTIRRLVGAHTFDDLRHPLTVTATDMDSGEMVLFGDGGDRSTPLAEALYASCALPLYYPPARLNGRRLADGGLRAVLPLEVALRFQPETVFAVSVGPSFAAAPPRSPMTMPPLLLAHNQALRVLMASQTAREIERVRASGVRLVLVEPRQEQQSTFAVETAARYVEEGLRAARAALDEHGLLAFGVGGQDSPGS